MLEDEQLGAPTPVSVTDKDVVEVAKKAVTYLNGVLNLDCKFGELLDGTQQVVSGTKYDLSIALNGCAASRAEVEVLSQPWKKKQPLSYLSFAVVDRPLKPKPAPAPEPEPETEPKPDAAPTPAPGGILSDGLGIVDIKSSDAKEMAREAVDYFNTKHLTSCGVDEITEGYRQGARIYLEFTVDKCPVAGYKLEAVLKEESLGGYTVVGVEAPELDAPEDPVPGGYQPQDPNSPLVKAVAERGVELYNKQLNTDYTLVDVISAESRVVGEAGRGKLVVVVSQPGGGANLQLALTVQRVPGADPAWTLVEAGVPMVMTPTPKP